jgi:competence protein ComEC
MNRPLWITALCYAGGVLLGWRFALPIPVLLAVCGVALTVVLVVTRARPWLLAVLAALLGWANYSVQHRTVAPDDLRHAAGPLPAIVTVRGTLLERPEHRVYDARDEEVWRTHCVVAVEQLATGAESRAVSGRVAVTAPGAFGPEFHAGRRVEIAGVLQIPRGPAAPGLFDYGAWLRQRGIHFHLATQTPADWALLDDFHQPPLVDRFEQWSRRTLARGLPAEDEPLRLTWAMALGWRTALTDEVAEPFMRSGTMHLFAISGLHVVLIAELLVALLRAVRVPRGACGLIALPLLWFYTAATGWQPSAIRSAIMMSIVVGGWALRRPGDLLNSLGAAAFVILALDPGQLFQASFQLSFFVVLNLALLLPPMQERVQRWLAPDPLLPPELRVAWRRRLDWPVRWTAFSITTSFAAWLGSLPLTAYYFNLFTPVSLPANVVIVPLSAAALACNLGSLLCGGWLPWIGELFNHAGWFWMRAMDWLSEWFARWPGAYWHAASPTVPEMVAYYAVLFALVSGWALRERRWRWFTPLAVVVFVALTGLRWWPTRNETTLTVLPLSGGEAVWINAPGRANDLLLDCGDERTSEMVLKPFLRAQGVNFLPRLALTHGDLRNIGGWPLITREFRAAQTITSPLRFRSTAYRAILDELEQAPGRQRKLAHGDTFGPWRLLHPAADDTFSNADDGALVLLGEFHGTRVLLLSDLGRDGQRLLLEREPELRADLVIAGLPERDQPLSDSLLARLQPKVIFVTDAEQPATQRASRTLRDRLERSGAQVLYGRETGVVTIRFMAQGCRMTDSSGRNLSTQDHQTAK